MYPLTYSTVKSNKAPKWKIVSIDYCLKLWFWTQLFWPYYNIGLSNRCLGNESPPKMISCFKWYAWVLIARKVRLFWRRSALSSRHCRVIDEWWAISSSLYFSHKRYLDSRYIFVWIMRPPHIDENPSGRLRVLDLAAPLTSWWSGVPSWITQTTEGDRKKATEICPFPSLHLLLLLILLWQVMARQYSTLTVRSNGHYLES